MTDPLELVDHKGIALPCSPKWQRARFEDNRRSYLEETIHQDEVKLCFFYGHIYRGNEKICKHVGHVRFAE